MFITKTHDTNEVCKEKKILTEIICDIHFVLPCGNQGIYIYRFNSKNEDEEAFNKESQDKLYRYITKLYGKPIVDKDNAQLDETYLKEFSYQFKDSKPLAIWKNVSSRMVLLLDRSHELEKVIVFAEPRK